METGLIQELRQRIEEDDSIKSTIDFLRETNTAFTLKKGKDGDTIIVTTPDARESPLIKSINGRPHRYKPPYYMGGRHKQIEFAPVPVGG